MPSDEVIAARMLDATSTPIKETRTMESITLTISAPDIETLMQGVLDLAAYDDITVQLYRRPKIAHGDLPS